MKKYLLLMLTLLLTVSMVHVAQAITIPAGPLTFHWTNWETRITGTEQPLSGIFRLDQILDSHSNTVWSNGDGGQELTGVFSGLTSTSFGGETPGSQIGFSGGNLKVYLDNVTNFNPTKPGSGVTDGTLWIDANFVTGGNFFFPGDTLHSTVLGIGTDPKHNLAIFGTGSGLLDVVGGSAKSIFDTNTYPRFDGSGLFADLSLSANFYITNTGSSPFTHKQDGWDVWSSDPIGANAIPEPASMLLLGMGVVGLATGLRKKKVA